MMILMSRETIYEELEESERQIKSGETMDARKHLEILREKYALVSWNDIGDVLY